MKAEFNVTAGAGILPAGLAANSTLFALRVPTTLATGETNNVGLRLKRLTVNWRTVTGFTAEQEVGLNAYEVSAFGDPPADYTGGNDLFTHIRKFGPDLGPKPLQTSVFQTGNMRLSMTAALAHAGTPTVASFPFARESIVDLAAAATVPKGAFTLSWAPSDEGSDNGKGLVFTPGTGLVIRTTSTLGAGGSGRLWIDLVWAEQ